MEGLNAFIVLQADEHKFIAIRNGSPLVVGFGDDENFLASDAASLLPHTRQVHFLEDDQMAIVTEKGVMIFNARTGEHIKPEKQHLDWTIDQAEKGKYQYFMLKEIYEQIGLVTEISLESARYAEKLATEIKKADDAYLIGCGSASYACIAGTYLFSKIAKRHVHWAVASEFSYQLNFLNNKSLVIALSQSGETIDTLDAVRKAKAKGARIFALVNTLGSSLYREADYKMLIGAGPEKSVASTKAMVGKLSHLTMLAYALAGKTNDGKKTLADAAKSSREILAPKSIKRIKSLAKMLKKQKHIYVIGRGLSYPASLEAALKIKEISYIHAEGFAAGELKHGVIALIEKGTPCIAFLPNDETYGANLAGAMEMKARGGYIIGVSHKPHEVFDFYIPVKDAKEATIIPNVIVGQILAYYLTLEKGLDPDMPRNLAKSVTVK
jgi:glucosamine--fructose-6-phosphate aminotransferase (isomerizing)